MRVLSSVSYQVFVAPALDPITAIAFAVALAVAGAVTLRNAGAGAALLAVTTPFDFQHAVLGTTVSLPKAVLVGVIIGLIPHLRASATMWSAAYWRTAAAFAAILVAIALSLLSATYRSEVAHEFLKWCEYAAYFTVFYAAARVSGDRRPILWGLVTTIVLVCASALVEEILGAHSGLWIAGKAFPRIAGALEGPNQLGAYCEIACAFLGAWSIASSSRAITIALFLTSATLFLTFSRGSMFGLGVVLLVLGIVHKRQALAAIASTAIGGAAVFLFVGGLLAIERLGAAPGFMNLIFRAPDASEAGGVGTRSELWRAALYFFTRHPLFGIGAGNFEFRLPEAGVSGVRTHANSWYLQSLAEGGVSLFAATLFLITSILASLRKSLATSPWALAAFAATCALALHQIVDDVVFFPKVATLWCILMGVGIAATSDVTCESPQSR